MAHHSLREALLGAAVLGELHLLHRVGVDPETDTVRVYDPSPTGVPSLDAVLDRIGTAEPRPAEDWAELLGPDAQGEAVARFAGACVLEPGGDLRWLPGGSELYMRVLRATRARLVAAVRDRHTDGPAVVLGRLLYTAGLAGEVLRHWPGTRARLAELAASDWLARAVRRVQARAAGADPAPGAPGEGGIKDSAPPYRPVRPRRRPWGVVVPLLLAGAALVDVGAMAGRDVQAYTRGLREDGAAIDAAVVFRRDHDSEGRPFVGPKGGKLEITVTLAYAYEGRTYREVVRCTGACPTAGETARIWADRDDPTDFVTAWGDYNDPPEGDTTSWVFGLFGGMLVVIAMFALLDPYPGHRRRHGRQTVRSAAP